MRTGTNSKFPIRYKGQNEMIKPVPEWDEPPVRERGETPVPTMANE